MQRPLPEQRIVRGVAGTISHQFVDSDGDEAAPSGAVTVSVTRSNGTAVTVGSVSGTGTDPRTVTVGIAETAVVDQLTAVWSIDGTAVATDTVDVVGGTIGSVAQIVEKQTSLKPTDPAKIKAARSTVEARFVETQFRSPVLRLTVERMDGTGQRWLSGSWPDLVAVRWARVYTSATTYTALTADQLAAIKVPDDMSRFERSDTVWPCGRNNIEIGYVFGMSYIPQSLRDSFYLATRVECNAPTTGVPERATTWQSGDGVSFGVARPGQRGAVYGIDEIDAVWNKHRDPRPVLA